MRKVRCLDRNEIRLALGWAFPKEVADIKIRDVVEDSATAEEMVYNLNNLNPYNRFVLERVTSEYARAVSIDDLGNETYIKAYF